ncbi:MAG: hypothetical protein WCT85_07270 [Parachlamydiales bacterium]|jgi:hypothetical protein
MTQPIQSKSNFPFVDKVAFWKEDKTAMKIVKVITAIILIPLAFIADLINKGINYVWPKKATEVKTEAKEESKAAEATSEISKEAAGIVKVKNIFMSNKNAIALAGAALATAVIGFYAYSAI